MSFHYDPNVIPTARPTEYDRLHDYAAWEAANPDLPPPGAHLNEDFNAIERALDQTQDRLELIQRDDGALKNGIVTKDSLEGGLTEALLAQLGIDAQDIQDAADLAESKATEAAASAAAAAVSAQEAEDALAGVNAAITLLDTYTLPVNLPVVGGETTLDYLDAQVDIDAIELVKNGLILFRPQDYTIAAISGGVRFTLVAAAVGGDKYWVRTPRTYRVTTVGAEINALDTRLDTLEGQTLDARLDVLEGQTLDTRLDAAESALTALDGRLDTAEADITALEAVDAAQALTLADHESRIDDLETGGLVGEIASDTTYTVAGVGADYATFTAVLAAIKHKRILPGARLTLQMTGNATEPGALVWSHPDSKRIVLDLNGANRSITLGGYAQVANAQGGANGYFPFVLPPGDVLTFAPEATATLTLVAPAANAVGGTVAPDAILYLAGRIDESSYASGVRTRIAATSGGATPVRIFMAEGAHFAGIADDNKGVQFTLATTSLNTALQSILLNASSGVLLLVGEGDAGTSSAREQARVDGCHGLTVRSQYLGCDVTRSRIEWVCTLDNITVQATWLEFDELTDAWVQGSSGSVTIKRVSGGGSGAVIQARGNLFVDDLELDAEALTMGNGMIYLNGPHARGTISGVVFADPPASGTRYAIYLADGARCVSVGNTFSGAFSSNKSNATATWSASTGEFLNG